MCLFLLSSLLNLADASARRRLQVLPTVDLDFGDAPDSYGTNRASLGAAHDVTNHTGVAFWLGDTQPDIESDAYSSMLYDAAAPADELSGIKNDEATGAEFDITELHAGQFTTVSIGIGSFEDTAVIGLYLSVFIDYNDNGNFCDGEVAVLNQEVSAPGVVNVNLFVPADATLGRTWVRFRVTSSPLPASEGWLGYASGGEVEDHLVLISPPSYANFSFLRTTTTTTTTISVTYDCDGDCDDVANFFEKLDDLYKENSSLASLPTPEPIQTNQFISILNTLRSHVSGIDDRSLHLMESELRKFVALPVDVIETGMSALTGVFAGLSESMRLSEAFTG